MADEIELKHRSLEDQVEYWQRLYYEKYVEVVNLKAENKRLRYWLGQAWDILMEGGQG